MFHEEFIFIYSKNEKKIVEINLSSAYWSDIPLLYILLINVNWNGKTKVNRDM